MSVMINKDTKVLVQGMGTSIICTSCVTDDS